MRFRPKGYKEKSRTPPGQSRDTQAMSAPGELALVQAFLNTVRFEPKGDELTTPRGLSDWLSRNGLLPAGTELSADDVARARDARFGLRALVAAHGVYELNEEAVTALDRAAIGARAQVRFGLDGSRLELISRDFDDALGTLLGIVHAAEAAGKWPAMKTCADPECRQAFYDYTKSLNGKWCCKRCGARIRARAHRKSGRYVYRGG